jgi:hypothetical protein
MNDGSAPGTKLGTLSKFAPPTIANGLLYAPTLDGTVKVYGISTGTTLRNGTMRNATLR